MVLAFLPAAIPLALVPGLFLSHDVIPKVVLILATAACALFLVSQWSDGLRLLRSTKPGRFFLLLVAAQVCSLVLSTLFSTQPALSFAGTVWRRFGSVEQTATLAISVATACFAARRPAWSRTLFRAIAVCGGIAALYGILQYFGVDPLLPHELYAIPFLGGIVRPPATMGNAIYFAAYLVPVALLAGWSAWDETEMPWKAAQGVIAALCALAIILSGTRASVLAVGGGAIWLGLRLRQGGNRASALRFAGGAIAVLAVAAAIALSPLGGEFRNRLVQWRLDPGGPRLGMWAETPGLVLRTPLVGAGPETFAVEFRKIESATLSRAYPDFYNETPHNAFLDAAAAQGIPGLLILAGVFVLAWRQRGRSAGLEAAIVGLFIGSFFASYTLVTDLFLWTFAGLLAGLPEGTPEKPRNKANPAMVRTPQSWRLAGAGCGLLFAGVAGLLAVQDVEYARLRDAVADKDPAAANRAYTTAVAVSLGMPGYELWGSREMATLGRSLGAVPAGATAWAMAAEAAARAETSGEERFNAVWQSSILAVASGDLTRAEAKAREASELAPNWYKAHLLRAQILQAMGRSAEAAREVQLSRELGWSGH